MKILQYEWNNYKTYKVARGLKYDYKIIIDGHNDFRMEVIQKWANKRTILTGESNDLTDLENFADKHNWETVNAEIKYHEKQLKALRKQWEAE